MVNVSFNWKPCRRGLMEAFGAECVASPSNETEAGRAILAKFPDSPGSLGLAISEAVEVAAKSDDTKYALGSVLNHVLTHQTILGIEAMQQMEMAGEYPDISIGCAIDEALVCKQEGTKRAILFNLSGHGHFDVQASIDFKAGKLVDQNYDEGGLRMALAGLPSVAG